MNDMNEEAAISNRSGEGTVKCVVWDLDNTLWDGVLLEGDDIVLREYSIDIIRALDRRGILQSVASKNDFDLAIEKLEEFGLTEYFLYPQINWNSKASSIQEIAKSINIGIDTIAFIDDEPYELEEVRFSHPEVLCIDAKDIGAILEMPEMNPRFITDDASKRRTMYRADIERKRAEERFIGPKDNFLATLQMEFTISHAEREDLKRAEELTVRTNQLTSTGCTYSYEELDNYRDSERHKLLIASLNDKYGAYGKIGLALIECGEEMWTIHMLLMSCRVMSRGVGAILLNHIMREARWNNVRLQAEFVSTGRNRMMYVTFKFAGFKEINTHKDCTILESDLTRIQPFPDYVEVRIVS